MSDTRLRIKGKGHRANNIKKVGLFCETMLKITVSLNETIR